MEKVKDNFVMVLEIIVIIVGLFAIVMMPKVPAEIDKIQEKNYQKQLNVIKMGAEQYLTKEPHHINWISNGVAGQIILPMSILQSEGYVSKKLIDPRTQKEIKNLAVKVINMNNEYTYETIEYVNTIGEDAYEFDDATGRIIKFLKQDIVTPITIPETIHGIVVKEIGPNAFKETNIIRVKLPNTVDTIGPNAFNGLDLKKVTIPDSVRVIGNYAFTNNNIETVDLGSGVETIGNYVFMTNQITSVVVPASVKTLGSGVFKGNALTKVTVKGKTALTDFTSIGYDSLWGNSFDPAAIKWEP